MKLAVLQYRKIHPELYNEDTITVSDFKRQLAILANNGYNTISSHTLYNYFMKVGLLPEKRILITFDGEHNSQYLHAAPILEQLGYHAVFFISGESLHKTYGMGKNSADLVLSCEQVIQIQKCGFEIGHQGFEKLNFANTTLPEIRSDLVRSVSLFNDLKIPLTNVFAYPYGVKPKLFWNAHRLYKVLKQEKIMMAFSYGNKMNDLDKTNRFNVQRISINGNLPEKNFIRNFVQK